MNTLKAASSRSVASSQNTAASKKRNNNFSYGKYQNERRSSVRSSAYSESRQSTRNHSLMSQTSLPKCGVGKHKNDSLMANDHASVMELSCLTNAPGSFHSTIKC